MFSRSWNVIWDCSQQKNLPREELVNNWQIVIVMVHQPNGQVGLQNWPGNLTTAMQVSIDTAMLHCEIMKVHILALMIELNRCSHNWWWCWSVHCFHLFPQVARARKVTFEHSGPGWAQELAAVMGLFATERSCGLCPADHGHKIVRKDG